MDANKKQAYAFLLNVAFLHLKWDLGGLWAGLDWWRPWQVMQHSQHIKRAAHRAVTFHNLATFLSHDMTGFDEVRFWNDVEKFRQRFPEAEWANYKGMFDRKLNGEEVYVAKPGG